MHRSRFCNNQECNFNIHSSAPYRYFQIYSAVNYAIHAKMKTSCIVKMNAKDDRNLLKKVKMAIPLRFCAFSQNYGKPHQLRSAAQKVL